MERRAKEPGRSGRVVSSKRQRPQAPVTTPRVSVALPGRQRLEVVTARSRSELNLVGTDGKVRLRIEVTAAGPVLHLEGGNLKVEVHGDLALAADRLALVGREELVLQSGGDLHLQAAQDLHSRARIQNIKADLGNVNLKANDDVRLNGERVMVNC
jgi:hypothetical protein